MNWWIPVAGCLASLLVLFIGIAWELQKRQPAPPIDPDRTPYKLGGWRNDWPRFYDDAVAHDYWPIATCWDSTQYKQFGTRLYVSLQRESDGRVLKVDLTTADGAASPRRVWEYVDAVFRAHDEYRKQLHSGGYARMPRTGPTLTVDWDHE